MGVLGRMNEEAKEGGKKWFSAKDASGAIAFPSQWEKFNDATLPEIEIPPRRILWWKTGGN